ESLAALTKTVNAVVPSVILGFARALDDGRVSLLYCYPYGIAQYVIPVSDVPDVLLPSTYGAQDGDVVASASNPPDAPKWLLRFGSVQRVVSVRMSTCDQPTRFWIGTSDPNPLTSDQMVRLGRLAEESAGLVNRPILPDEASERLRRLELAAEMLPALLRV